MSRKGRDLLPEKIVTRYMMKEDFTFYWFLNGWKEARIPEMFAKIPFCEKIAKACEVAGFSEEKYKIYQSNMKSERDIEYFAEVKYKRGREEGREEGRKEGREAGLKEGRLKIAGSMKTAGLPMAQIVQLTGLSEEEVSAL